MSALCDAPLEALGDCLATARGVSPALARSLVEALGGEQAVIYRIRANDPWITQLEIREGDGGPVGCARFLHVSEDLQGDPQERAHSIGRILLWCLPEIESVDVRAIYPGNQMKLINDLWPAPTPGVPHVLPEAHPSELAETIEEILSALRALSGISDLPEEQREHDEVQALIEASESTLERVEEKLISMPNDQVVSTLGNVLAQFAARVRDELDGTSSEPNFAVQCSKPLLTGEQTDESASIITARYFALEWDINPVASVEQLLEEGD